MSYSTRYVREMLNGEIPMRKCRKCLGRGEEFWVEIYDKATRITTFRDTDGPAEAVPNSETHEYYPGSGECEICDGLGWVIE